MTTSRLLTLDLTCTCGGALHLVCDAVYSTRITKEREAFDQAHAVCREREPKPLAPTFVPELVRCPDCPPAVCTASEDCRATDHVVACPSPSRRPT